ADAHDGVLAEPAVDEKYVYFGSRDGQVYSVNRSDGKPRWKRSLGGPVVAAPTLLDGRGLYVASTSGRLEFLNLVDGEPYWSLNLTTVSRMPKAGIYAAPIIEIRRDRDTERRRIYIAAQLQDNLESSILARW